MMKKLFCCFMLCLSIVIAGCGTDYNQVFNSAKQDFNAGNYEKAKNQFNLIINNSDDSKLQESAKKELENYEQKVAEHKKYLAEQKEKEIQADRERIEREKQEKAKKLEAYNEMLESYNSVLSNSLPSLYGGCAMSEDFTYAIVYVKPMWYSLNEGYKKAFVKKTMQMYMGMLGARSISINTDHLSFYIKDPNTNETLASWGSIRGIHIED